jgi:Fe-S-cluster containining protein
MQELRFRPLDDIGIHPPASLPQPIQGELRALVHQLAGMLRAETVALAAPAMKQEPGARLTTVLALMKVLVFGRAEQTVQDVLESGTPVACSAGCTACCYQSVEATIPEAILIALRLADPEDPRRERVLAAAETFKGLSARERRRTGRPCPLLQNDRCSVYDDRPLMCRSVLSSNAEGCRASLLSALAGREELPNDYFIAAQYFIRGDVAALQGICKDLGLQHEVFDLVQMLAALIREPEIIERWLSGERVFAAAPSRRSPCSNLQETDGSR